jgi:RNA polymerase sigma-70 factor (ECF subfamily)
VDTYQVWSHVHGLRLFTGRHAGFVLAYARRRTDSATADDVVADVFLTAWRRLADVPSDPLPWLLGIARRILANRRRGEARTAALHHRLATTARSQASDDRRGRLA